MFQTVIFLYAFYTFCKKKFYIGKKLHLIYSHCIINSFVIIILKIFPSDFEQIFLNGVTENKLILLLNFVVNLIFPWKKIVNKYLVKLFGPC